MKMVSFGVKFALNFDSNLWFPLIHRETSFTRETERFAWRKDSTNCRNYGQTRLHAQIE